MAFEGVFFTMSEQVKKIGIVGGGQLGKMMAQAAKKMGYFVVVLDPTPDSPAGQVSDRQIVGDFLDPAKLDELVAASDVVTFEIERAHKLLSQRENEGKMIFPSPRILELIQDKVKQKEMLAKNRIPTARYVKVEGELAAAAKKIGLPAIQKAIRGGYDGRGVFVIKSERDLKNAIQGETFLEEFVNIKKELAVNVAQSVNGEIKCHHVVEMTFNQKANICDMVIAPARVSEAIRRKAQSLAIRTVKALGKGAAGIFGIEMFLAKDGRVLVNEIAPRPHNSGHYSIEACITSQFEQHIRAVCGLPLGSAELIMPAVMVNLLGEIDADGEVIFEGMSEALAISGLSLHVYGKKTVKPFRKMGHFTVTDKSVAAALKKAIQAKKIIKVRGKK
jgi:5-(carboxyamino)imidazole ribonucleotide synthase